MANSNIGPGRYDCWANSNKVRRVLVKGERKVVVEVTADAGGQPEVAEGWSTLDTKLVTASGKKRISFTIDGLIGLGAVDPMRDIGLAVKADPDVQEIEVEGLGSKIAQLVAKESGQFVNLDVYPKREPTSTAEGAAEAEELLALSTAGKKAGKPAVANPFAGRPARGTAIAPPGARPAPIAPPRAPAPPTEPDTSFP